MCFARVDVMGNIVSLKNDHKPSWGRYRTS
jgi:hypothetical protein